MQAEPLRPVTMRQLFLRVEGWGYDALRKMVNGQATLQPDAIKAIARASGIVKPEYFAEYRQRQLEHVCRRHPEIEQKLYNEIMALAEMLEVEAKSVGAGEEGNPSSLARTHPRGSTE